MPGPDVRLFFRCVRKLACIPALAAFPGCLYAAPVVVLADPTPTFIAAAPNCVDRNGAVLFANCVSTAYLSHSDPADFRSPFVEPERFHGVPNAVGNTFESAFGEWNKGTGNSWRLVDGGALDLTFNVVTFDASVNPPDTRLGGVNVTIGTADYAGLLADGSPGPQPEHLAWSHALHVNYRPGKPDQVHHTLDTFNFSKRGGGPFRLGPLEIQKTAGPNSEIPSVIPPNTPAFLQRAYEDPIYPFQLSQDNGINGFDDGPRGFWDIPASFRGIALLSTVTFKTDAAGAITDRILTVYNGVSYGFDLDPIPEPAFLSLAVFLLIIVILLHRRRGSYSKPGQGDC